VSAGGAGGVAPGRPLRGARPRTGSCRRARRARPARDRRTLALATLETVRVVRSARTPGLAAACGRTLSAARDCRSATRSPPLQPTPPTHAATHRWARRRPREGDRRRMAGPCRSAASNVWGEGV